MRRRSAFRGLPLAGTASVGVLVGHWLAYVAAVPGPELRNHVLAVSGHGYWLSAVRVAVALAVAGLGTIVARQVAGRADPGSEGFVSVARRLALLQMATFTAMEVVERLASGASVGSMLDHHLFPLGIAAQLVVACLGALVLRWFGRTAAAVVAAILRSPVARAPRALGVLPSAAGLRRALLLAGAAGVRGPPPR